MTPEEISRVLNLPKRETLELANKLRDEDARLSEAESAKDRPQRLAQFQACVNKLLQKLGGATENDVREFLKVEFKLTDADFARSHTSLMIASQEPPKPPRAVVSEPE
jgi:hypothetical protein